MLRAEVERVTKSRVWADKSVTSLLHLGPVFWKDASLFYLLPPSIEVLWERLILRETQLERSLSLRDMENRVSEEIDELKKSIELPYSYVINQKLEDTVDRIVAKL